MLHRLLLLGRRNLLLLVPAGRYRAIPNALLLLLLLGSRCRVGRGLIGGGSGLGLRVLHHPVVHWLLPVSVGLVATVSIAVLLLLWLLLGHLQFRSGKEIRF